MEDLALAQTPEQKQSSGLQAEWMENQKSNITIKLDSQFNVADCLSFVATAKDKQSAANEKQEVGIDKAEKLDKELKEFAETKGTGTSRNMQKFQKAVGKFCDTQDKESAMDDLGETWSRMSLLMDLESDALDKERKEVIANTPGRKDLVLAHKKTQDQFYDKINQLPVEEYLRIIDLMGRQEGETKAQQEERIQKGLAGNKPVLAAYNEIGAAAKKIEENKSPREKELEFLSRQLDSDAQIMRQQVEKAYIRSTIKN